MPAEVIDDEFIKFWWGLIPGHTAYPWVFPNDDNVARVGLTMPIGLDLDDIPNRHAYDLIHPDDEQIPSGAVYIRRLLEREYGDEYDIEADFPIVEARGKQNGTEAYPISSTRPIDSPTAAGIAVIGGAMGATSAFHEGGDHVAVRTGKIAGTLAATDRLDEYNAAWKDAIGHEVLKNVALAEIVRDYEPPDWDRAFRTASRVMTDGLIDTKKVLGTGMTGMRMVTTYKKTKFSLRDGGYVQLTADQYQV
jgi:electron-transferring-flavoprotein dehydrogenase